MSQTLQIILGILAIFGAIGSIIFSFVFHLILFCTFAPNFFEHWLI